MDTDTRLIRNAEVEKTADGIMVSFEGKSGIEGDMDITLIAAVKSESGLVETGIKTVTLSSERELQEVFVPVTKNGVIEIYFWNSITGMAPVAEKVTVQ